MENNRSSDLYSFFIDNHDKYLISCHMAHGLIGLKELPGSGLYGHETGLFLDGRGSRWFDPWLGANRFLPRLANPWLDRV